MHLLTYVEINVYSYYCITCLPCQCCSESSPQCNLRWHQFSKFFWGHAPRSYALHAVHHNTTMIWKCYKLKLVIIISIRPCNQVLVKSQKFYLKRTLLILKTFSPWNIPAIWYTINTIHRKIWSGKNLRICLIEAGADPDFNKGVLKWEGLYSGKATVTVALQLWGCVQEGLPLPCEAWKLEQLGYSVIQKYCKIQ